MPNSTTSQQKQNNDIQTEVIEERDKEPSTLKSTTQYHALTQTDNDKSDQRRTPFYLVTTYGRTQAYDITSEAVMNQDFIGTNIQNTNTDKINENNIASEAVMNQDFIGTNIQNTNTDKINENSETTQTMTNTFTRLDKAETIDENQLHSQSSYEAEEQQ
jgi:hypothetical protein